MVHERGGGYLISDIHISPALHQQADNVNKVVTNSNHERGEAPLPTRTFMNNVTIITDAQKNDRVRASLLVGREEKK